MSVRKKRLMLVGLVLLVFGGVLFFTAHRQDEVVSIYEMSATDVAEIKRLVHLEKRREIFPDFSWSSVVHCPAAALRCLKDRITTVYVFDDGRMVFVGFGKRPTGWYDVEIGDDFYQLIKDTNGWHITNLRLISLKSNAAGVPAPVPAKH
jgi:hypothetical protein